MIINFTFLLRKFKFLVFNCIILFALYGLISILSNKNNFDYITTSFESQINKDNFEIKSIDPKLNTEQNAEEIVENNLITSYDSDDVCKIPKLKLIGHDSTTPEKPCKSKENWGYIANNTWYLSDRTKRTYTDVQCDYRVVNKIDDFKIKLGPYDTLIDGQKIMHDVFEVKCTGKMRHLKDKFDNLFAQIVSKLDNKTDKMDPNLHDPDENKCTPLNIMLISYDSVSRVSWMKRLNKTYEFITNEMKFDILNGYNIVGDGTPAALIPIYAGKTEEELPSVLKNDPKGKYVDEVYPFIWKELHNKNYMTLHLDDWPHIGAFTYRMRGFKNHTAKHYLKHYQLRLWERIAKAYYSKKKLDDFCMGDKKRHLVLLDLIREFKQVYNNKMLNMVLMHYVENSHDDNNRLNWADQDLFQFFSDGFKNNMFDNTAIFLFSDHGVRFTDKRGSSQRYLEERMPFFSLYLPESYKQKYPVKYENLKANLNLLTSPFDIYATVRDLTCLDSNLNNENNTDRSISLLDKISTQRKCEDIGISEHYCICVEPWETLSKNSDTIVSASKFSVDSINSMTESVRNLCEVLTLKEIISAESLVKNNKIVYKIEFITMPNKGIYEVLVHGGTHENANFEFKSDFFNIKSRNEISRIDAYGSQPKCVSNFNENPEFILDLRKFCFCKKTAKRGRRF